MTITRFESSLADATQQVDAAIAHVDAIDERNMLAQARIALDAARELAKLNGQALSLRIRLTRLELHIARRAGQLGVTVKGVSRSVASWYANKTDVEIDALIDRHHGKQAAASIMKAEVAFGEYKKAAATAASQETIGRLKVADASETLMAIVGAAQDEFYDQDAIKVDELADYVSDLVGVKTFDESATRAAQEGLRLGLWDAVRKTLATGDLDDPRLEGLPRWITCRDRSGLDGDQYYMRVPTAKATIHQLGEYIDLIERKAHESAERAARLQDIRAELVGAVRAASAVDGIDGDYPDWTTIGEAAALAYSAGWAERRSA